MLKRCWSDVNESEKTFRNVYWSFILGYLGSIENAGYIIFVYFLLCLHWTEHHLALDLALLVRLLNLNILLSSTLLVLRFHNHANTWTGHDWLPFRGQWRFISSITLIIVQCFIRLLQIQPRQHKSLIYLILVIKVSEKFIQSRRLQLHTTRYNATLLRFPFSKHAAAACFPPGQRRGREVGSLHDFVIIVLLSGMVRVISGLLLFHGGSLDWDLVPVGAHCIKFLHHH